ncbi:MAG: hypothetical protein JSU85_16565 [Candidatus Zixiibacteriota bacterium]|nr:MAG: hypothetical protein JSU85_16565 [candidate division Zixibacteria bacterium]
MKNYPVVLMALTMILLVGCQGGSDLTQPVAPGEQRAGFSPLQDASLGDYVWYDDNMDGIQNTAEAGIAEIVVNLYTCDDTMVANTVTDTDGYYAFDSLDAGDYYLEFELPDGYVFTLMDQGGDDELDSDVNPESGTTDCFTLTEDQSNMTLDAGMYQEPPGCTWGKGFWKNHTGLGPQPDLVTDLLPIWLGDEDDSLSIGVTTAQMAYDILQQHEYGHPSNGITRLYAHLLAAKLNIANGADDEDIAETITDADAFLGDHNSASWDDLGQDDRQMVNGWKDMLEDYNEGEIGPGSCDEYNLMD